MDSIPRTVITHISEYYGSFTIRCVGTIDIKSFLENNETNADLDYLQKWFEKFHPSRTNHFAKLVDVEDIEKNHMKWEVWMACEEDNQNWKPIPGTPFFNAVEGRLRGKAPFIASNKFIDKWLKASERLLIT